MILSAETKEIIMPLAYLADPWQKMKVHEEMEVKLYSDELAMGLNFSISSQTCSYHSSKSEFPISQVADEEMTDVNKNGVSWIL